MAARQLSEFMRHLRRVLDRQDAGGITDGELVKRYVQQRDETAFEALLRRHGPMVFGVCLRVLHNQHDAEDAFQTTFLILVRKASSLRSPGMIGNWLYGVAYRTALHVREAAGKRRAKEAELPAKSRIAKDIWADLRPALDLELERLPDKYRSVIVLCDLEGKTRKEAARHLGRTEGTVASRLARGRVLLAKRLARHGLTVSGGTLAAVLSQNASASVPASAVSSTIKAASLFAAGKATAGVISANVAALTEGVLEMMFLSKLKLTTAVLLIVALTGVGVATLAAGGAGENQTAREVKTGVEKPVADTQKENAAKKDELQGAWEVVSVVQGGKHVEESFFDGQVWVFTGNMLKGVSGKMTYTLYPSEKPKAIDVIYSRKKGEGVITGQGIYELKGDELKIVLRKGGNERPKEFEAKDANTTLTVLKRIKIGAAPVEMPPEVILAQGTQAVAFKLSKDQKIPDGVVPGRAVDVIAEISEPIKTGFGLFNVKLLAIDAKGEGGQSLVTVQVTPTQHQFLMLAEKESTSLRIKPHLIEKPPALH